jgi:two-component system sensor histidine kinase RegB
VIHRLFISFFLASLVLLSSPTALAGEGIELVDANIEASDEGTEVMVFLCVNGTDLSVVVSDHGCGFPAEILQRVGEPFFSTKAASRGMGLGLFVANLFIERYGGQLSIESRPNHGTTVSFYLRGVAISRASQ